MNLKNYFWAYFLFSMIKIKLFLKNCESISCKKHMREEKNIKLEKNYSL